MLRRITRGLLQLRKLRDVMDEVYRLFDRRCRSDTALAKLAKLRSRVRRFKQVGKTLSKLFSPNLDKALTFLDDKLLPSTSNAVERRYRRHRKMQKSIYRVRTMACLIDRIALDMFRDLQSLGRSLLPPKPSIKPEPDSKCPISLLQSRYCTYISKPLCARMSETTTSHSKLSDIFQTDFGLPPFYVPAFVRGSGVKGPLPCRSGEGC